jgi:hypothetical protein
MKDLSRTFIFHFSYLTSWSALRRKLRRPRRPMYLTMSSEPGDRWKMLPNDTQMLFNGNMLLSIWINMGRMLSSLWVRKESRCFIAEAAILAI